MEEAENNGSVVGTGMHQAGRICASNGSRRVFCSLLGLHGLDRIAFCGAGIGTDLILSF